MLISMILLFIAGISGWLYACWLNNDWYRFCDKMNDSWYKFYADKIKNSITVLPQELDDDVQEELEDYLSDKISETTGYCHKGYQYKIVIDNIEYDTDTEDE